MLSQSIRTLSAVALLAGVCVAHGGFFRPPPGGRPGDPFTPTGRPGAVTAAGGVAKTLNPWESWWYLNREPYLRFRERVRERTVISGSRSGSDPFDRSKLREDILVPLMLEALGDREEEVRTSAAVALGKFGAANAIPPLLDLLRKDKIRQVRESAMLGLMLMRDPALRDRLREMALDSDGDRRLRAFAILGLGFLKDTEFLRGIVTGKDRPLFGTRPAVLELRTCATLASGYTDSSSMLAPLAFVAGDREAPVAMRGYAGPALGRLGNTLVVSEIMSLVGSRDAKDIARYGAAMATGRLVRPDEGGMVDVLGKKAQRDRDPALRSLLVMSLGRIGGTRAATHLVAGMRGCERDLRGYHFLALGISGFPDAGAILLDRLGHLKSGRDRAACALGIGLTGHRAAAPALRKLVEKGHPAFLPHGMVALGLLDDTQSIPLVEKVVAETNDTVARREGAIALALLRRSAAVPALVKMLESEKTTRGRGAVAWALGYVGTQAAVEPLLEIYRDKRRSGEERAIALAALGRIGDEADIPLLAELATDVNPYVLSDAVAEVLTIL